MKHEDPATRLASVRARRKMTGKDDGVDAVAWEKVLPKVGDDKAFLASKSNSISTAPGFRVDEALLSSASAGSVLVRGGGGGGKEARGSTRRLSACGLRLPIQPFDTKLVGDSPGCGTGLVPGPEPEPSPRARRRCRIAQGEDAGMARLTFDMQ